MASDAVLLHHGSAWIGNNYGLRLHPHREDGGVPHSIFSLEKVLAGNVIVRYVTVVAGCPFAVRAVKPGGVLRAHDVAVNANVGFVREVRMRLGYVEGVGRKPGKDAERNNYRKPPLFGWCKQLN